MSNGKILYGGRYHIKNMYSPNEGYLDTNGKAECASSTVYDVSTSKEPDRAGKYSGTWVLHFKYRAKDSDIADSDRTVRIGDEVYIENKYNKPTFLDTCGRAKCAPSTVMGVSTSKKKDREDGSGVWKIVSTDVLNKKVGDYLEFGDDIHLKNMWGKATYLDSCGRHSNSLINVSTSSKKNRENGSGIWSIEPEYITKWKIVLDTINYNKSAVEKAFGQAKGTPKIFETFAITNNSPATITKNVSREETHTSSFEFKMEQSLSAKATVTGTAGVPGVASASVSLELSLGLSFGQKWTTTEQVKYKFESKLSVPPYTEIECVETMNWMNNVGIPAELICWVSATDISTGKVLSDEQIKKQMKIEGFDGKILDDSEEDMVLVSLAATLKGSWGVFSNVQATGGSTKKPPNL